MNKNHQYTAIYYWVHNLIQAGSSKLLAGLAIAHLIDAMTPNLVVLDHMVSHLLNIKCFKAVVAYPA